MQLPFPKTISYTGHIIICVLLVVSGYGYSQINTKTAMSKPEFGKPFIIELKEKAGIGNLTIDLMDRMSEWSVDPDGNYEDSFSTYELLLYDGLQKGKITYMTKNMYYDYVSSFKWGKYTIEIIEDMNDSLKLLVRKEN